jgi:scyllo-inositol 2-dehydrogenase (NADP+)
MKQHITTAIVGLGRAGWHLHLTPMLEQGSYSIEAVADPVAERVAEAVERTGCRGFASIDALLAGTTAELVVVATPSPSHFEDIAKVLESGRHCIAEKPLAMTGTDAAKLVALARERGVWLFTNHGHLHRDEFAHLRDILAGGTLGPLFHLRTFWGGYSRRWDWQTLKGNGGGELNNTCPHPVSLILPLLGSPVRRVYANLRNIKNAGDAEDFVHVVMECESGVTADMTVTSAIPWSGPKWTLAGKFGTLHSDGASSRLKYYDPSKVLDLSVVDGAAPGRQYLREQLPWVEEERPVSPTITPSFHQNVHDVLRAGAEPVVTPESAAEVVRVIELARLAAESGERL